MSGPIVIINGYHSACGMSGAFHEELREFIARHNPQRQVRVIGRVDDARDGVIPLIDPARADWWRSVAAKAVELEPYVIHIPHEYGLYQHVDDQGLPDNNEGFLDMLNALGDLPKVVETHDTIHGRLTDFEAEFFFKLCRRADAVLLKHQYQKWRLRWTFTARGWPEPSNLLVVPHGARADRRYSINEVPRLRVELGIDKILHPGGRLVGMIGWIQGGRRWNILTDMWESIAKELRGRTDQQWDLMAEGDGSGADDTGGGRNDVRISEQRDPCRYWEFHAPAELRYKLLAICNFVVLPTLDESRGQALASMISLNKPYITAAPMGALTAHALESGGGLLFTSGEMLRRHVVELASSEPLRLALGENLKRYLDLTASWDIVAAKYNVAYELARQARQTGKAIEPPAGM